MKGPVLLLTLLFVLSCRKDEIPLCSDALPLHSYASYPVGVAVDYLTLTYDSLYEQKANSQFNSYTPENAFKPEFLHPEQNFFYWAEADSLVAYCQANHKRLHGHTLIWHEQLPEWITSFQGDTAAWDQLMKHHIQTIVTHFKGVVNSWDVVNEAFEEDGSLRNSIWHEKIGSDYIERAFVYAHEADPEALLFYNDYNLESNPKKRRKVIELLNRLREKNVPVHGIGLQMHVNVYNARTCEFTQAFEAVTVNHYLLHLSEIDISINPKNKAIGYDTDLLRDQAILLGKLIDDYNRQPAELQYGVTFWGVSDAQSWIRTFYNREDYPLLYNDQYQVKPCYCQLQRHLQP